MYSGLLVRQRRYRSHWVLKDTWRTIFRKDTEGDILYHLNELGVRNIPTLAIDGDVIGCTEELEDAGEALLILSGYLH